MNGIMSFGSMYPPIFRERKRLVLNRTGLQERLVHENRDMCVGIHPEGTRNKLDNPYELLPPQAGVGQLIQSCQVPVIPAFINGLSNDFKTSSFEFFKQEADYPRFWRTTDFSEHYEKKGDPSKKKSPNKRSQRLQSLEKKKSNQKELEDRNLKSRTRRDVKKSEKKRPFFLP